MAKVVFEHVTKRFGSTTAIDDLNLEIQDGEFLVLVGPSGCGKSTALRLLAGLEAVSSGHIYIGERRVDDLQAKDRALAMVFQSYALSPHMSVRDNIAFGLKLRKVAKEETRRRVDEAAGLLGIENLLDRKPAQLSGGQRQRVALDRAIVREPAAFLLDEPLSNLDAKLRVQTRAELTKLYGRLGTTFVYVTHDQVGAVTMATRIAVRNLGHLQQVGTPKELYERPVNQFVAGFIGSPAMNFFDTTVEKAEGGLIFASALGRLPVNAALTSVMADHIGADLVLGIRPEDVHDPEFPPPGIPPTLVETKVDLVEAMGSETYLYLLKDDLSIVARVDSRSRAQAGETFQAAFNLDKLHVFEKDTGLALNPALS
jgi:multiple sugar transport system ATP-binding protein